MVLFTLKGCSISLSERVFASGSSPQTRMTYGQCKCDWKLATMGVQTHCAREA